MTETGEGVVERGEVVGVGLGSVDVRIIASAETCGGCNACSRVEKDGMVLTDVMDQLGAAEGDRVEVMIPAGSDLRAGLYAYVMPVLTLLLGYGVGDALGRLVGWPPDTTGAVCAILAFVVGMLAMRQRLRKVLASDRFRPRLRAIIARGREATPSV